MRKAKSCYGCYAYSNWLNVCLLNYRTETYAWVGGIGLIRPVKCCHKPKTTKEYFKRLSEVIKNNTIDEVDNDRK